MYNIENFLLNLLYLLVVVINHSKNLFINK
jgi:hypothetical protein